MSNDAYAPPAAELETETLHVTIADKFYVVSPLKFFVLYIGTFGVYSLFWFYMNWRQYKIATGEKMWPVARAIFSIFFTHSLFAEVVEELRLKEIKYEWAASTWATVYVLLSLVSHIIDRIAAEQTSYTIADAVVLACAPVILLSIYRAQKAINISQGDPKGASNSRFTIYNFIWLFLSISIVIYAIAEMSGLWNEYI